MEKSESPWWSIWSVYPVYEMVMLILCSYRDPNLAETLKVYEELPDYLSALVLSEREMTKYVIGTMAAEEIQLTPFMKGERALAYYLTGNTRESRMKI